MKLHDCPATLTDSEVLEFCRKGFHVLEGVVPEEINRKTIKFLDTESGGPPPSPGDPNELLHEDWFVDNVIISPEVAGAVRSLLGKDFGQPIQMTNHRGTHSKESQFWHRDGGSQYGPELNYLQVFYLPQDVSREMGPTEVVPGSHFLYSIGQKVQNYMGHYGRIRGSHELVVPAGTVVLTVYSIWHRRAVAPSTGVRHNLKYCYFRTTPPRRDWITEADFDLGTANYGSGVLTYRQQMRDITDNAEMFCWLCGKSGKFSSIGGQGWPLVLSYPDRPYGVPVGLEDNSPLKRQQTPVSGDGPSRRR